QLRYAQLDRAGAGLPVAIAVSIAVVDRLGAAFAMTSAGQPLDLQRHQTLCRKADHLAQQVDLGTLLQKRPKAHHLRGHRRVLGSVEGCNQTLPKLYGDHRRGSSQPPPDSW